MTTKSLKKELHIAIDSIDDSLFLEAIYTLVQDKSKENDFELSEKQKTELDKRVKRYKEGKGKSYSVAEVKKYAISKTKR